MSPLRDHKSGFLGDLRAGLPNRLMCSVDAGNGTGLQHKAGRNYHPFNGFQ